MSRPLLLLLSSAFLAGLSFLVTEPDADPALEKASFRLQEKVDKAARDLTELTGSLSRRLQNASPESWFRSKVEMMEEERRLTGSVFQLITPNEVIFWSGGTTRTPGELWGKDTSHIDDEQGSWLHVRTAVGPYELHGFRPIWLSPAIENRFLNRGFHPSLSASTGLWASTEAGVGLILKDGDGAAMLRLGWQDGALEVGPWLLVKLLLLVLSAGLLIGACWDRSSRLVRKGDLWKGVLLFIGSLVLIRVATLAWLPSSPLDRLPLFDPVIYATSFAFASLGDLLINAVILCLMGVFLWRAVRSIELPRPSFVWRMMGWMGILLLAEWVTRLIIGLVNDSSIDLDLYHVQGLSRMSLLAVLGMALLLASWLIISMSLLELMVHHGSLRGFLVSGLVVLSVSIVLHHLAGIVDTVLFLWPVPVVAILVHGRRSNFRFIHVVLALALISAFGSHVLSRRSTDRERRERRSLAERLATREDPVVEQLFRETAPRLRSDATVHAMLTGGKPCNTLDLDRSVRQRYFGGYWERYDVRLFAFGPDGKVLCSTDAEPPRSFSVSYGDFSDPTAAADMPELFIEERSGQSPFYHARVAVMPEDRMEPVQLIIELYPRSAAQGLGFPALLLSGDDPVARRVERYSYARYESRVLVERSGNYRHPLHFEEDLGTEGLRLFEEMGYEHLAKGDPGGTIIVLSLPVPSFLDKATTFSYLFVVFSVLLALVVIVRSLWKERGIPTMGIGAKVRAALILFAIAGLVIFGYGAQRLLAEQYEQRFAAGMLDKARSVHQELQQRLDGEPALNRSHVPYLDHLLGRMSNVFFTDITLYSTDGRVLSSSRPQIFAAGLLGERMDAMAFARLSLEGLSAFVHEEAIGSATFSAAYLPLRDREGSVLAYIALPGFADRSQQEQERSAVLVAVVNLFVLLFALSVLVAVFISYWTARPLDLLKNALARVELLEVNEPIRYRGDDEVGRLVEVYNRKVAELRESAEQLARSQRESAWREMARQVAHEIKNPLTPMKLSIQHFQRSWDPAQPDAQAKLERFGQGLVQQIDVLSRIAGEFSHFAQMPPAHPTEVDLREVATSAIQLFHGEGASAIALDASGPVMVYADKEHLLRVFNNLLKNALQAIPEDRDGRITVRLTKEGERAIVAIADNGSGIPPELCERVFEPNFTTRNTGMGLGLAMVRRIVEHAGGTVQFETRPGQGTTFFVELPLQS